MRICVLFLALLLATPPVTAQRADDKKQGKWQGTSKAERQRIRDDMRQAYGGKGGPQGAEKGQRQEKRQMSPEQRESLRRDMQDTNRSLKR